MAASNKEADAQSRSLVNDLEREGVQEALKGKKGKQREGTMSDHEVALRLYDEELALETERLADLKLCESIRDAVDLDGDLVASLSQAEHALASDRQLAQDLSGNDEVQRPTPMPTATDLTAEDLASLSSWNVRPNTAAFSTVDTSFNEPDDAGEGSSRYWSARGTPDEAGSLPQATQGKGGRPCTACSDDKPLDQMIVVDCGHQYCHSCLKKLFTDSLHDPTLFPAKCCRQTFTETDPIKHLLGHDVVAKLQIRAIELSQPRPTYCSNRDCGQFIVPTEDAQADLTCPACNTSTCTLCKNTAHTGECDNEHDAAFKTIAEENGWQQCPRCNSMIALEIGCNHMR
ncbi:MAG: hypothetical protein M1828_006899 [Chrysothrix sp. TS-e1954]|nr:MAG: hypothetical protein M1828_006899 [Chrysothrix sp. TS-e1954]